MALTAEEKERRKLAASARNRAYRARYRLLERTDRVRKTEPRKSRQLVLRLGVSQLRSSVWSGWCPLKNSRPGPFSAVSYRAHVPPARVQAAYTNARSASRRRPNTLLTSTDPVPPLGLEPRLGGF